MKKSSFLLAVASLMVLAGCGEKPGTTEPEPSTPSVATVAWSDEAKALMQTAIGMVLPDAPLSETYQVENYVDPNDGALTFYAYDEGVGDVCAAYGPALVAAGFEDLGVDNSNGYAMYGYAMVKEEGTVAVQIDYFPGAGEYKACFEIYAWMVAPEAPVEPLTEWDSGALATMQQAIGAVVLPVPNITTGYEDGSGDAGDGTFIFYIYDENAEEAAVADYQAKLVAAGYTEDGVDNSMGYDMYVYYLVDEASETTIVVAVGYFPGSDQYAPSFELQAYAMVNLPVITEWPAADVAALTGDVVVPSFEAAEYTVVPDEGSIWISAEVATNIEADYTAALEAASWTIDNSKYDEEGIYALDSTGVVLLNYYYSGGWFNVMVIVDAGSVVVPDDPTVNTISILPSDFSGSYGTDVVLTKNDIDYVHTNVMCGNQGGTSVIQMKKGASSIANTTPFTQGIATISINDIYVSNPDFAGSVVVYAVAEDGTKTAVEGVDNVYNLGGAQYFAICNEGNYAFYCGSIDIVLVEAPAA